MEPRTQGHKGPADCAEHLNPPRRSHAATTAYQIKARPQSAEASLRPLVLEVSKRSIASSNGTKNTFFEILAVS